MVARALEIQSSNKDKITVMWQVLNARVLTWDQLQKRGKLGHEICMMCKSIEETNAKLFLHFSYVVQVWTILQYFLDLKLV